MLAEKLKNAETTNWLAEKLTESEIKRIRELAIIAAKIEMKRNELGMNQKEFAKMMNVSQGMVSKWESGEYNFTVTTLKEICEKLGMEFEPVIRDKNYCFRDEYKIIETSFSDRKHTVSGYGDITIWSKQMEGIA